MDTLPAIAFLRLWQIVGDRKANPPVPALIPVSKSTWLAGCKSGRYPQPIKLGPRSVAWKVADIRTVIDGLNWLASSGEAGGR